LDEHQEFAEDSRDVPAVYFINDEEVWSVNIVTSSLLAEPIERSFVEEESSALVGAESHHEVLVGVTLMELHHLESARVLAADDGVGESFGSKCLAHSRWASEDDVLLSVE